MGIQYKRTTFYDRPHHRGVRRPGDHYFYAVIQNGYASPGHRGFWTGSSAAES